MSASARRRHDALLLQRGGSPESLSTAAAEPTSSRYKWTPRAPLSTHATSDHPYGTPLARIRPGEASFLISGNHGRRHCPGHFGTTEASPSPFSPPRASSSSREPSPPLNFDRDTPREKNHLAPEATSAEKLAAGSSLRPHLPGDHREDRPGVADPSPPSEPRGERPFAGDDRRSPAPLGQRRETTRGDWSNLTSGPGRPTVSDTPRRPRG